MATYGLNLVYEGKNPQVDIVFLHGLRGHVTETWTKDGVLWPKALLSTDVPDSRIFLFGYDSSITHADQSKVSKTEIHSDAEDVCSRLAAARSNTADRPIIFIAHSLGGLVAAQVLVHGQQRDPSSGASSITKSLRGMIFLGTPFRGSLAAKPAEIVRRLLEFSGFDTQQHTLKLLGVDSERLDELTRAFPEVLNTRRISKDPADAIRAYFFYETLPTSVGFKSLQVVAPESAQIPGCGDAVPIRADHISICKFKDKTDEGYTVVLKAIRDIMRGDKPLAAPASKTINMHDQAKVANLAQDSIYFNAPQTNNF